MPPSPSYRAAPRFSELGANFSDTVEAAEFGDVQERFRNNRAAAEVGLDTLDDAEWKAHFAAFEPLPGNQRRPIAMRYHGHQFDHYNPQLGDGRGFLFAQMFDGDGRLLDLGTKGSGQTPYSRNGDGRLTLKGGVREILATEMLEALGVNTSRTFSLFETGEALHRGDEPSPTRAAVMVRLSHSHVRIGTFQRHAYHDDTDNLRALVEHAIENYHPDLAHEPNTAQALVERVAERSAAMCAQWMVAGFVHGVLNSDNQNITGESFDYGPWRFLPTYDLGLTAAYFDQSSLYCYGRQPQAVLNNCERLVEALRRVDPGLSSETMLEIFQETFSATFRERFLWRLGVEPQGDERDTALVQAAVQLHKREGMGFAALFHDWFGGALSEARALTGPRGEHYKSDEGQAFRAAIAGARSRVEKLPKAFEAEEPCDMLIDEVEALWKPIAEDDDWSALDAKLLSLRELGAALAG